MNSKKTIAALIINWNGAIDTIELLRSLFEVSANFTIVSFVVDNASDIEDLNKLKHGIQVIQSETGMSISLIENKNNVGVPAAYNQAIQSAGLNFDYYLRLDNDVVLDSNGLAEMTDLLDAGEKDGIAIVGGNVKYYDNKTDDNGGAVKIDLVFGKTFVTYPKVDEICDGVLGCIMLISKHLIRKYAPRVFLDSLFICTDESELSLRAKMDGFRTLYTSKLVGFHKSGRSTSKVNFLSNYYSTRNWVFHRLRFENRRLIKMFIIIQTIAYFFLNIFRGNYASSIGTIAGYGLAITWHIDHYAKLIQKR